MIQKKGVTMSRKIFSLLVGLVLFSSLAFAAVPKQGSKTATLADTNYQLSTTATRYSSLTIVASSGNAGIVYVGFADITTSNGIELSKNDSITYNIKGSFLDSHYIRAVEAGDSVRYILIK